VASDRARLESDGRNYTSTKTISGRRYPDTDACRDPDCDASPNANAVPGTFTDAHVDSCGHTYCDANADSNSHIHTLADVNAVGYSYSYSDTDRDAHAEAYA
jgi:hypothetical protein